VTVVVPHSRLKEDLVKLMVKTGHLGSYSVAAAKPGKQMTIKGLKLQSVKRLSKPGMRFYANHNDLRHYLKRRGATVLSTSKGLMTAKDAFKQKLGGELICHLI
jgi:small subunit ribosomal protein S8